jgi:thiol-disulfide isomerase/thioredoxin
VTERLVILVVLGGITAVAVLSYSLYRRRSSFGPERINVDDLGLELMYGCCAFVVFTSPSCTPCRAVLRVVEGAAAATSAPTEVRTVDTTRRHELAERYNIRTVPTTLLITASGHVVARWRDVPRRADVDEALNQI